MNLHEILDYQRRFDVDHGWRKKFQCSSDLVSAVEKDVVGLVGEFGEFSNIIKKASLIASDETALNEFLSENKDHLSEELIDTFVYLLRLFAHFDVDIEASYLEKMKKNELRFKSFRNEP